MLTGRPTPAVAGAYLFGAVAGAALSTAILTIVAGLLSPVPATFRAIVGLIGLAALTARTLGVVSFPLPQNARQIPQHAFARSAASAAWRFAFQLGTAARTYVTADAPYAAALLIMLALPATPGRAAVAAVLIAVGFGFGRSMIVLANPIRNVFITTHPGWSLKAASFMAMATSALVFFRQLG